ncbi:MAG: acetylglutamate kinase [Phycisphaerales bacterium]|nr:acetylglutamate kinase [Phycisphaerales bacterium]
MALALDSFLTSPSLTRLREQSIVVKLGGSIQDDPAQLALVARDVALMHAVGARVIVVHGGGKAISAAMTAAGLPVRFVAGQRYTDAATLRVAERVLARAVNPQLVSLINDAGAQALGLHSLGACVLSAHRTTDTGKPGDAPVDLGLVGRVPIEGVAHELLNALTRDAIVPVVAPIAIDLDPEAPEPAKLNVNADLAAGTVASAVKAHRFIMVSDTRGVRRDPKDPATAFASLSRSEIDPLIATGVIDGGMLPKLQGCLAALSGGCARVCIVDGRTPLATLAAALDHSDTPGTWIHE